jgi:hypothetical protein
MTILEPDGTNESMETMLIMSAQASKTSELLNHTVDNSPIIQKEDPNENKNQLYTDFSRFKINMLKDAPIHDDRVTMKYYGIYKNQ